MPLELVAFKGQMDNERGFKLSLDVHMLEKEKPFISQLKYAVSSILLHRRSAESERRGLILVLGDSGKIKWISVIKLLISLGLAYITNAELPDAQLGLSSEPVALDPWLLPEPPLSPQVSGKMLYVLLGNEACDISLDCCGCDMVLKRGSPDCHCVYSIKLEILLLNVSQNANWNRFLEEFTSDQGLVGSQIELIKFYWVTSSSLNISMNITSYAGISFSDSEALAINVSLSLHKLHIDPKSVGVGDYEVLNFTWFQPPAPSQAKPRTINVDLGGGSLPYPSSTRFLSYEEVKEATNNFEPASILGEGGFGRVCKGVLSDGTAVAIKGLTSSGQQRDKRVFGPIGINCPLDWDTRMKIALDAARGLHTCMRIHNHATEGRANYLSNRMMGTFGMWPECAMTGHLLVKCDVCSYGVVLLELLTGRKPYQSGLAFETTYLLWKLKLPKWSFARPILRDEEQLEELADPKLQGKYPREDFIRVCTIAAACVAPEANQRPITGEVMQSLKMLQRATEFHAPVSSSSSNNMQPNIGQSLTTFDSDGTSSNIFFRSLLWPKCL
ncbi:hypothetical protein Ancab_022505 [Ancistrocladus abbreviatus]